MEGYRLELAKQIDALDRNKVLQASLSDLSDYFIDQFHLDVPRLKTDEIHSLEPQDTQAEARWGQAYDEQPHHLPATIFGIALPFDGNPDMFKYRPSTFFLKDISGEVQGNILLLRHETLDQQPNLKSHFDQRIEEIQQYFDTQRRDVQRWNDDLPQLVRTKLEERKGKILQTLKVAESLYPLKRRDAPSYHVPVTRKRLTVQMPTTKAVPYVPEPELAMQQYEEILKMIAHLAIVMERNPSGFAIMGEEQVRDQLLMILNSQFEGLATGETFNRAGKTDILIREKDRNIFIAECKFWDGPKTLTDAVSQILSYAAWRDTKLAVVVFNRRKDFSAVLKAIPSTVTAHPQCKRQLEYKAESSFRFLFCQPDDRNRELTLTVLAFDVPAPEPSEPVAPPAQDAPAKLKKSPSPRLRR